MSKTQFRPKVEIEPYNSKLTTCFVWVLDFLARTLMKIIHTWICNIRSYVGCDCGCFFHSHCWDIIPCGNTAYWNSWC